MLPREGVRELGRQRMLCVCVCLHILDRYMDREISLPQQVCPLALFHLIWGYRINLGKHVSLFLSLPLSVSLSHTLFIRSLQMKTQCAHSSSAICLS